MYERHRPYESLWGKARDDAVAILNLKSTLPSSANSLSLTSKDFKGDQNSKGIQDLDGNDLESFRNFDVEII